MVICVLVLYNPDYKITSRVIESILPQVDTLFIADNSPIVNRDKLPYSHQIVYKKMPGNVGIAAAQNAGIKFGINNNYKYLFFLDQDSICPDNIVESLISQYNQLKKGGYRIGAIGPRAINRSTGKQYRGLIKPGKMINAEISEVTELISSASLVELSMFDKVGLMDAQLFIDGVDHEWCWRATYKMGCRFFIVETVLLSHQLGEGDRFLLWKRVAIPTPFRTYYQFRNYLILCNRSYVPIYWKIINGIKYIVKAFYYPACIAPRLQYVKNILHGVRDGIMLLMSK